MTYLICSRWQHKICQQCLQSCCKKSEIEVLPLPLLRDPHLEFGPADRLIDGLLLCRRRELIIRTTDDGANGEEEARKRRRRGNPRQ